MTAKVSLLISDENRLFREGVRRILASRKMEIVGEVRSLVEALEGLRSGEHDADLILCDPSTDTTREFEAMKEITQEFPAIRIVLLTDHIAHPWLDMAVEAGAGGFLPKDISADALRFSLELVLLGEQIFPTLHSLLESKQSWNAPQPATLSASPQNQIPLSTRESQILGCLVNGLPNKTIARNLNMAEATVKVHLKALLRKLNARNRTQAAIWGMNNSLRSEPNTRRNDSADYSDHSMVGGAE